MGGGSSSSLLASSKLLVELLARCGSGQHLDVQSHKLAVLLFWGIGARSGGVDHAALLFDNFKCTCMYSFVNPLSSELCLRSFTPAIDRLWSRWEGGRKKHLEQVSSLFSCIVVCLVLGLVGNLPQ